MTDTFFYHKILNTGFGFVTLLLVSVGLCVGIAWLLYKSAGNKKK